MKLSHLPLAFALTMLIATSALAEEPPVYTFNSGTWSLNGYVDSAKPENNACVLNSKWVDGSEVKVNVFPKYDGKQNVTMTVYNPAWNFALSNKTYKTTADFYSNKYTATRLTGYVQVKASDRLIFRRMTKEFSTAFIHYDNMIVFAGTQNEMSVDLTGTAALVDALDECNAIVLNPDYAD